MKKFKGYQIKVVADARVNETTLPEGNSPELLSDFWHNNIACSEVFQEGKEHLVVIPLNTRYKILGWNLVSMGSLNESLAHPREVFRPAIVANAHSIIVMHNHPSGRVTPSEADTRLTRRLNECSEILQIRLLDHIIVSDFDRNDHYSFRASGLI